MARASSLAHRLPWLLLAAILLPAAARGAVPVALYPLQSEGLTEGERAEVQAVVESALLGADRRGVLEPRTPLVLPAGCKPPISVGCVATLAKGGVVLYARARRRGAQILVTVLFVDGAGRRTRAAAFPVDLFIQNLRPAHDAIATVEAELVAGALEDPSLPPPAVAPARPPATERPRVAERLLPPVAAPVVRASPPEPPAPPPAAVPSPPALAEAAPPEPAAPRPPLEPPAPVVDAAPAASASIDLAPPRAEPPRPPRLAQRPAERDVPPAAPAADWRRRAGTWFTAGGVTMLVAGAAVGLTGQRLSDTLSDRYARGALRPEDSRLYDRVDLYGQVANALFVTGGIAAAAGLTFHAIAPARGGAGVAVAGSF